MHYFLIVIRILVLLFSFYGMAQFLKQKYRIKSEFILPVVLSSIGVIMFLAGILNVLSVTAYAVCFIGVLLGIKALADRVSIKPLITYGTVLFATSIVFLLVFTLGNKFTHYDNFSHWAMVLRQIINTNSFPNFDDTNIMFQSYPTGSAALIYYFAKTTGIRSEWFYIFSQQIITVAMLCSVFAFFKGKKIIDLVIGFASVLFIILANGEYSITHDLLVDTLLPLIAVAAVSICIYYRDRIKDCTFFVMPLIMYLMAVKNSGILFVVAVIVYYLYRFIKVYGIKSILKIRELVFLTSPFITLLLWNRHTEYVFDKGLESKHSMSAEYYSEMLEEKTPQIISQITKTFFNEFINIHNTFLIAVLILVLCFLVLKIFKIKSAVFNETCIIAVVFYICWQLGTFSMYLLSMPTDEALRLDGYERYHQTALIFVCGLLLIIFAQLTKPKNKKFISAGLCLLISLSFIVILKTDFSLLNRDRYMGERNTMDSIVEQYDLDTSGNTSYFLVWDNGGYQYFMSNYVLNPKNMQICSPVEFDKHKYKLKDCDYLIVIKSDKKLNKFLLDNYGSSNKKVYKIGSDV